MLDAAISILFIGNSLTATNNVPAMLEAMGKAAGVEVRCAAVAKPNFSLEDHWNDGEARRAISYAGAATLIDGVLFPVGDAWRAAWRRDPRLALYGPDGFHPSPLGTSLAALVIFNQVMGLLPTASSLPRVSADDFSVLVAATREVAATNRRVSTP
jgi:hypothetical protein